MRLVNIPVRAIPIPPEPWASMLSDFLELCCLPNSLCFFPAQGMLIQEFGYKSLDKESFAWLIDQILRVNIEPIKIGIDLSIGLIMYISFS